MYVAPLRYLSLDAPRGYPPSVLHITDPPCLCPAQLMFLLFEMYTPTRRGALRDEIDRSNEQLQRFPMRSTPPRSLTTRKRFLHRAAQTGARSELPSPRKGAGKAPASPPAAPPDPRALDFRSPFFDPLKVRTYIDAAVRLDRNRVLKGVRLRWYSASRSVIHRRDE